MHTDHDREQYQILLFMLPLFVLYSKRSHMLYYIGYGFVFAEARSSHHIINDYMD